MTQAQTRILHVEDDPSLQNLVRITLAQLAGYAVDTAGDGFRAIELATEHTPDLILLDLDLPGVNGIDTLKALREVEALRQVPVIFLTAASDLLTQIELLELGALTVLQKPVRPRQLVQTITRALGRLEP
jgi:DNA-binding response OmpR family regulator